MSMGGQTVKPPGRELGDLVEGSTPSPCTDRLAMIVLEMSISPPGSVKLAALMTNGVLSKMKPNPAGFDALDCARVRNATCDYGHAVHLPGHSS